MNPKDSLLSRNATFLPFYYVNVALVIAWEVELLDMDSEDKLQPVSQ